MKCLPLVISLVFGGVLGVCYVLMALFCILSVVPFLVYDVRYDREGTGSKE